MTLLYDDPVFLEHNTGSHPENASRLKAIGDRFSNSEVAKQCVRPTWSAASVDHLSLVHSKETIADVHQLADAGGGRIDADTVVSPRSYEVARRAAGAACDAVKRVMGDEDKTALCLIRPPGHHALPAEPMGFCLFNNVGVAAKYAVKELDCERVMIVDWDVHHGNGTQAMFWKDAEIGFLSMHRFPFYPGSGRKDETGSGPGLGTTVNIPITMGTSRKDQISALRGGVESLADKMKPDLVLVSAGFDSHSRDPIGSLGLESEDFVDFTQIVQDVASVHAKGRIACLLEGGYNPTALAESVECHLGQLAK